jgi:GntR family transcriptional regulator
MTSKQFRLKYRGKRWKPSLASSNLPPGKARRTVALLQKDGDTMIFIDPRGGKPIFEQIKDSMRERILSGVWGPNDKLPSVRELAQTTAINPNTIQKAYRELELEGFLYTVAGRGCYAAEAPEGVLERRRTELLGKVRPLLHELRVSGMTQDQVISEVKAAFE